MRQYLEPTDVINSIKLLLKHPFYSDKLILIVEGTSDIRFFRSIFDYENVKIESIDGKKSLIFAMEKLVRSHKLTKITKHAKRHFWLNDICTCHELLPSHSA